jgi:hypothetical protein
MHAGELLDLYLQPSPSNSRMVSNYPCSTSTEVWKASGCTAKQKVAATTTQIFPGVSQLSKSQGHFPSALSISLIPYIQQPVRSTFRTDFSYFSSLLHYPRPWPRPHNLAWMIAIASLIQNDVTFPVPVFPHPFPFFSSSPIWYILTKSFHSLGSIFSFFNDHLD